MGKIAKSTKFTYYRTFIIANLHKNAIKICNFYPQITLVRGFYMELNYTLIGIRIKRIRMSRKITQDKLSEMSDISPQHLSQIESGKTKLSLPTLVNICNALDITADRLLCDVLSSDGVNLDKDIADVFGDCTPDERYIMLATAENLKQTLRLKKIKSDHE